MQDRQVYQKKGRQRVAPRKKKFTALKKKVLQERLKKWRELHPEEEKEKAPTTTTITVKNNPSSSSPGNNQGTTTSCSICVYRFTSREELEDDDEYDEIVENLRGMATKIGEIEEVFIPRDLDDRPDNYPAFVKFKTVADASAAKACWDGLVVGGESLEVVPINESSSSTVTVSGGGTDMELWSEKILAAESMRKGLELSVAADNSMGTEEESSTSISIIILEKVLTEDDYEDEECMNESLDDLRRIAEEHGAVLDLRASDAKDGNVEIHYPVEFELARMIADRLCKTMVSGTALSAFVVENQPALDSTTTPSTIIVLEDALTEDDLEDEDCLNETLNDIQELAGRHGQVSAVAAQDSKVVITYVGGLSVAQSAVKELDGMLLGGMTVKARIVADGEPNSSSRRENSIEDTDCLYLKNFLTEDDLEDKDCLEESLNDVRNLASKYGEVVNVDVVEKDGRRLVRVILYSDTAHVAQEAAAEFDGMVIGGQIVSAATTLSTVDAISETNKDAPYSIGGKQDDGSATDSAGEKRKPLETEEANALKKARTDKQPLYSGDKIIPERFAECKRVPKIPNVAGPREYAKLVNDELVRPLLQEMLGELMRLQKRATEDKNAKARRRLVMGLREVARGIRAHKVKMVVIANNLDEYGAIDDKLQEIIDLARSEDVPLFFEFTKRSLGKAVGKSIKVAVVGIQNADGAHQPFKKLQSIAVKM
jgi:selenocysteine insertion sequence-binding protein 2